MSDKISNTTFPRLNQLKQSPANKQFIPEDYKKVARGIEKQFAEEMLRQMTKTTGATEGGTDAKFYRSLMESERAQALTQNNGGLGIQDMILDEIYPKRMRNELALRQYEQSKNIKRNAIQNPQANGQEIGMYKKQSSAIPANSIVNAKEASDE